MLYYGLAEKVLMAKMYIASSSVVDKCEVFPYRTCSKDNLKLTLWPCAKHFLPIICLSTCKLTIVHRGTLIGRTIEQYKSFLVLISIQCYLYKSCEWDQGFGLLLRRSALRVETIGECRWRLCIMCVMSVSCWLQSRCMVFPFFAQFLSRGVQDLTFG